jgi:RNA polymerase sigma factor (sigma-70 family)
VQRPDTEEPTRRGAVNPGPESHGHTGPDTTRRLTEAISSGDAAAFDCFYRAWFNRVFLETKRATGRDESFCLDVVQDVMMKVVRAIPVLETEPALAAWLRRCVLTTARDRIRADARRTARERQAAQPDRAEDAARSPTTASGSEHFDAESLREIERLISALDANSAQLITARFRFGWTLERIAHALGIRTGAADGRLSRLLANWRKELSQRDRDHGKGELP